MWSPAVYRRPYKQRYHNYTASLPAIYADQWYNVSPSTVPMVNHLQPLFFLRVSYSKTCLMWSFLVAIPSRPGCCVLKRKMGRYCHYLFVINTYLYLTWDSLNKVPMCNQEGNHCRVFHSNKVASPCPQILPMVSLVDIFTIEVAIWTVWLVKGRNK